MKKRFIFDENYIKRYKKKDEYKWLIIGASVLVLITLIIVVILIGKGRRGEPVTPVVPKFTLKKSLTIEAGSETPKVEDYFEDISNMDEKAIKIIYPDEFEFNYDTRLCSDEEIERMNEAEDFKYEDFPCVISTLNVPATYGITLVVSDKEYVVNLEVIDTAAPLYFSNDLNIKTGEEYKIEDFTKSCYDVSGECNLKYYDGDVDTDGNIIDYSSFKEPGEYIVKIVASDLSGNTTDPVEAKLKIVEKDVKLYTVTFNSNGGTEVASVRAVENASIVEPTAPTKDGYKFLGWYVDEERYDFVSEITKDITLVAKWEKNNDSSGDNPQPKPPVNPNTPVGVTKVTINFNMRSLKVGETKQVTAKVSPSNATDKTVKWSSENASIAVVDNNGNITGVKAGTTYVVATSGGKSAKVQIIVSDKSGITTPTCPYGDDKYNKSLYSLSVNLTKNGCAVDPNRNYNDSVITNDNQLLTSKLGNMGFKLTSNNALSYTSFRESIKNVAGTGLVGYRYRVVVIVYDIDDNDKPMRAEYTINEDGSWNFKDNNIVKNGQKLK